MAIVVMVMPATDTAVVTPATAIVVGMLVTDTVAAMVTPATATVVGMLATDTVAAMPVTATLATASALRSWQSPPSIILSTIPDFQVADVGESAAPLSALLGEQIFRCPKSYKIWTVT